MNDYDLIKACVENNPQAQNKLFERYRGDLIRYLKKHRVDNNHIDEILNIVFLRVFAKIHTYSFKGSFNGWLLTITKYAICDFFNVENKRVEPVELQHNHVYGTCTENSGYEKMVMRDYLKLIKSVLPHKQYFVFMKYYEGYTHKQIGHLLDITEGTSKWHVSEARRILKEKIK